MCIHADAGYISKASGVGKKSAERVIVDLKDKVGLPTYYGRKTEPEQQSLSKNDDALDALIDEAVELTVTDRDAAEADYIAAQQILAEEAYYLNLYDQVHNYVVSNAVEGVAENPAYSYTIDYYQVTAK